MKRPYWIFLSAVFLVLAGAGGWWLLPQPAPAAEPVRPARATRAEIRVLEGQAVEACRCARRQPDGSPERGACWAGFERDLARYEHRIGTTMCMPISPELVCFGRPGSESRCIVKSYGGDVCTREEARILEAIWHEEQERPTPGRDRWAEAVQAFIRGESVAAPRSSEGCSG